MRDPARIKEMIDKFEDIWEVVPDWRFGQLLSNLFGYIGRDPFYIEDDKMDDILYDYLMALNEGVA